MEKIKADRRFQTFLDATPGQGDARPLGIARATCLGALRMTQPREAEASVRIDDPSEIREGLAQLTGKSVGSNNSTDDQSVVIPPPF